MKKCTIVVEDEINVSFDGLEASTRKKIVSELEFFLPHAKYTAAYKLGRWNGKVSYATMGGKTFINLVDRILPIIEADGYTIDLVDRRPPFNLILGSIDPQTFSHKRWPEGHPAAGEPVVLREYQVDVINRFLGNPQCVQQIATGSGKCQPYSSRVLTESGWRTMGEITMGDRVRTPDGSLSLVLQTFEPGIKDVYEIVFSDDRAVRCCGDHLWTVYTRRAGIVKMTTYEILEYRAMHTHAIGVPLATFENDVLDIPLPMEPHSFGLSFGSGALPQTDVIPEIYYRGSLTQRLAIIRGMLDSQAVDGDSGDTFITDKKSLAEEFVKLIHSVGGMAKISQLADGDASGGTYIVATAHVDPKASQKHREHSPTNNIVDMRLVSKEPVKCILIDHPSHLYLTDGYVVTHNTLMTASMSHLMEKHGRTIVIVPNKSLVTQTEDDYKNLGLDVGVYYGDRKEYNHTHTICTWQSLEVLYKNTQIAERGRGHLSETEKMNMLLHGTCWCCEQPTTQHAKNCVAASGDIYDFVRGVVAIIVDECFAAGTKIKTPLGWKSIEDFLPGDEVLSYNTVTGEFENDTVVELFENMTMSSSESMYELEMDNGNIIQVTGNHQFFTRNRGWVRADELTIADDIVSYTENQHNG
jgi:hypothetical protein